MFPPAWTRRAPSFGLGTLVLLVVPVLSGARGSPCARAGGEDEFLKRHSNAAEEAARAGRLDAARAAWIRVLEREPRHLPALAALARLARARDQTDEALHWASRFLDLWRHSKDRPAALTAAQQELAKYAVEADPFQKRADLLKREHVTRLLKLAHEQLDHGAWHSARAMLLEARATDPEHPDLAALLTRIQKEGGNELAVADEAGGVDPLAGASPEWIAEQDPLHAEWDEGWRLETPHYRVRTNAGYRVLRTIARAMEQVHAFYRQFHQYKTKGEAIPVANVWVFKNREEYVSIGKPPHEWAGGHWDGATVWTYDARAGGEGGLAGMLQTLFHEASHQFTSLCGGPGVPAWLNEGMASFFEGTKLLSNGKLDWNLVVPGRLYPLVSDLRSTTPHRLEDVVRGQVDDYRVYYPWGWGIVHYLYNAEDADGRLLYRASLPEYFQGYGGQAHLERFVEYWITRPKVPGVTTLSEFESRLRDYAFALEAEDQGLVDAARKHEERADRQVARGDFARAVELYERALERDPDHPDVLWKLAFALEKAGLGDRAAGTLRRWLAVTTPDEDRPDPLAARRVEAGKRIAADDKCARRLSELRAKFHADALQLARDYDARGFPRLALRVLRGPATALPPSSEARALYFAIADRSGASLESWRLLFDERTLRGFYGGGEGDFSVSEGTIVARIGVDAETPSGSPATGSAPAAAPRSGSTFAYRRLFIDQEPAGDWSLSAEVRVTRGGRMAGLCFGKKTDGSFHGAVLLPEGRVDLARFGARSTTLHRANAAVGEEWHRLQIEVAGTRLVVTVDGAPAIEWEFRTRAELRGDFGLLAGDGISSFRDVKWLEFDASLPRRTPIGRRQALEAEIGGEPARRAEPGRVAYLGERPPAWRVREWLGAPIAGSDLEALGDWPLVVAFWTTTQESRIPLLPGLLALHERWKDLAIPIVLVSNEDRAIVEGFLREHPLPFGVALDDGGRTYEAYAIAKHGLPRAYLLGLGGVVVWEGNPDYKAEYGTYLDEPLSKLVESAKLAQLAAAQRTLNDAEEAFVRNEFARAAAAFGAVAALDVAHPRVAAARAGLARVDAACEARIAAAAAFARDGRVLQAAQSLESAVADFPGRPGVDRARKSLAQIVQGSIYKGSKGLGNLLRAAEKSVGDEKLDAARAALDALAAKIEARTDPWVRERSEWLRAALRAADTGARILTRYRERFPGT